jgi:hypothetical protein
MEAHATGAGAVWYLKLLRSIRLPVDILANANQGFPVRMAEHAVAL